MFDNNYRTENTISAYNEHENVGTESNLKHRKSKKPLLIVAIIVAVILLVGITTVAFVLLTGNGRTSATNNNISNSGYNSVINNANSDDLQNVIDGFVPPADLISVDVSQDDPSNSKISFTYDNRARIVSCTYTANGNEYKQQYSYDDASKIVHIYTYYKTYIVAEKSINYSDISATQRISTIDGYYVTSPELNVSADNNNTPTENNNAKSANEEYTKYIGGWSNPSAEGYNSTIYLGVSNVQGDTITFFLQSTSANASHIANTNNIQGTLANNQIEFDYQDSWNNYGHGTLTFKNEKIHLTVVQDGSEAENTMWGIWNCNLDLEKTSNEAGINMFN